MSTLKQEFEEAIDKHLSKEVGTRLQSRLRELENKEAQLEVRTAERDAFKNERDIVHKKLWDQQDFEKREQALETRAQELEKKERDLEITVLKIQNEEANKRALWAEGLAMGLVRNTNYRKGVFDSKSENVPYQYPGGGMGIQNVNNSSSHQEDSVAD